MNTKEIEDSIGWLKSLISNMDSDDIVIDVMVKQTIKLLQQGEKHKQMWESMVNASKCLIDPKGRKVLKMVVKDIKQGMKESEKYLKGGKR